MLLCKKHKRTFIFIGTDYIWQKWRLGIGSQYPVPLSKLFSLNGHPCLVLVTGCPDRKRSSALSSMREKHQRWHVTVAQSLSSDLFSLNQSGFVPKLSVFMSLFPPTGVKCQSVKGTSRTCYVLDVTIQFVPGCWNEVLTIFIACIRVWWTLGGGPRLKPGLALALNISMETQCTHLRCIIHRALNT